MGLNKMQMNFQMYPLQDPYTINMYMIQMWVDKIK